VSRQREFLADSAAVQFTRNPIGLAGALRKIGGLASGSRIRSTNAEEASHFFFADGIEKRLLGFLSTHPPLGERIRDEDIAALARVSAGRRAPQVQIVVSDGLNANSVNEQLRALMPPVVRLLAESGVHLGDVTVVIANGRVRAGYHAAQIIDPDVVVHILGERPGTGLNTASAYLTYGRDRGGHSRWCPELDHSCTTAVCGIHPRGRPPEAAAAEIARHVVRMVETRHSGMQC